MSVYITHCAARLPNAPVTNDAIEQVLGEVGGRASRMKDIILERNGIRTRHYSIDPATRQQTHSNASLTAEAVELLLSKSGITKEQVDILACGTSSPDQWIPHHAAMVQGILRLPPCEVISTAGVCCSSMAALKYAIGAMRPGKRAVVTGSELASAALKAEHFQIQLQARMDNNPFLNFENEFLRWMLSDGAGAFLLESTPNANGLSLRVDWMELVSFAGELETCMYAGAIKHPDGTTKGWREAADPKDLMRRGFLNLSQDARTLEKYMVPVAFKRSLEHALKLHPMAADEFDWLLPHMSSEFFRQPIAQTMRELNFDIPPERWFTNLASKGNTGSASILIMLDELVSSGRTKPGDRIMCVVPESARFSFAYLCLTVIAPTHTCP